MINYDIVSETTYWFHFIPGDKVSMFISYLDESSLKSYENELSSLERYGNLKNMVNANNWWRDIVNYACIYTAHGARVGAKNMI